MRVMSVGCLISLQLEILRSTNSKPIMLSGKPKKNEIIRKKL